MASSVVQRPNPEWSSSITTGCMSTPWGLAALFCPCCLASWTAMELWRDDTTRGHALFCGMLWPLTGCQLRFRTRQQLHLDTPEYGAWGHCDACTVLCCPCCSLSQQAREVYMRTRKSTRTQGPHTKINSLGTMLDNCDMMRGGQNH